MGWDWTETNKPHGWASKLACAFRLRACVGIKTEHHHWSVLHRQPFMTEVTVTLPIQTLLSRSLSRACRTKIEQRVKGRPHGRTRGYFTSYFCTCTTFSASYTYKSTCACTSTTSSNHVGFFVRRTRVRRTNVRARSIQMSLSSSLAFQIKIVF